ncbi:MAG: monovalent cation/H+ antiporter subunit D family protein, partial [Gemmatimonadetes bacterium]|nr:monovalent cation/H+ antiporter subunit D family protein [Gemmatimonadota bacterium]
MLGHLPILLIALPLVSAPLCVLLRRRAPAWVLSALVSWLTLGMAGALLAEVLQSGPVSYALGSWSAPWGIEYRVDAVNAFVLLLVSLIGAVVVLGAPASIAGELPGMRGNLFYAAWLLCLSGQHGIVATGEAFNVVVF